LHLLIHIIQILYTKYISIPTKCTFLSLRVFCFCFRFVSVHARSKIYAWTKKGNGISQCSCARWSHGNCYLICKPHISHRLSTLWSPRSSSRVGEERRLQAWRSARSGSQWIWEAGPAGQRWGAGDKVAGERSVCLGDGPRLTQLTKHS